MAPRVYWLWLANRPNIGSRVATALLEHYGDPEAVYSASRGSLLMCGGLTAAQVNALCDKDLDESDRLIEECARQDIHILTLGDSGYPSRLHNIYDPPLVLYWYGKQPAWDARPMISIVGSRKAQSYGRLMASKFAASLTASGFLVVSGMAAGVDGAANQAALLAGGTVAVLGCGVDVCYPYENRRLYDDLRFAGTLVSEYPPGTEPASWHFPHRNRIISGLSVATIVIEAPERSGALITARLALEQGRDVYAVPGRLDERLSAGCNALIRDHAADLLTDPIQLVHAYSTLLRDPPEERRISQVFSGLTGMRLSAAGPEQKQSPAPPRAEREKPEAPEPQPAPEPEPPQLSDLPLKAASSLLEPTPEPVKAPPNLNPEEQRVLEAVRAGAQSTDQLIAATGLPPAQLLSQVTMLELNGLLRNEGGMISLC